MTAASPIGSYFEVPNPSTLSGSGIGVPASAKLVQSGRQALALVADALASIGENRIRVPEYLCDSMIEPFICAGWEILPYPLDDDLILRPETTRFDQGEVWLLAPYFGRHLEREVSQWAAERNAPVILDQTHCVLYPDPTPVKFQVASLRKTLPLASGGYACGPVDSPPDAADTAPVSTYLTAERDKSASLETGASTDGARELYAAADAAITRSSRPQRIDARSKARLEALDGGAMLGQRRSNAEVLVASLSGLPDLRPLRGMADSPAAAFVSCRTSAPRDLQGFLASHNIFCPIHWPEPTYLRLTDWRNDLISLPIDHRYGVDHMERIAVAIAEYTAEVRS